MFPHENQVGSEKNRFFGVLGRENAGGGEMEDPVRLSQWPELGSVTYAVLTCGEVNLLH